MERRYQRLSVITNPVGRKDLEGFLEHFLIDGVSNMRTDEVMKIHYVFLNPLTREQVRNYSDWLAGIPEIQSFEFSQVPPEDTTIISKRFEKLTGKTIV